MLNSLSFALAYALFVAGLLGLVMGSFINCWAWRYTHRESITAGRSHCTSCGHELSARDLVPVFSWISTRGTCRYCSTKVSVRYPLTELMTAIAFIAIVAMYGFSLETVELLAFASILLFLSLVDIDERIIPNGCILAAIAVRVIYLAIAFIQGTIETLGIAYYVASAFGMGIAMLVVVLVADRVFGQASMGGGDLKLYFVAALYFGWQQGLFLVIASCVLGIIVAVATRSEANAPGANEGNGEPGAPFTPGENAAVTATTTPGEGVTANATTAPGMSVSSNATTAPGVDATANATTAPGANGAQPAPATAGAPSDPGRIMKRQIPFGPSIAAACVITMLVGNPLISWYLGLL